LNERKEWTEYFLDLADLVATRSTCPRAHHGAVLTRQNRILATGYNGSLPGQPHCSDVGCKMHDGHCTRTMHAEANAVAQAAKIGVPLDGATAFVTGTPCFRCDMLLKSAGIWTILWRNHYDNAEQSVPAAPSILLTPDQVQFYFKKALPERYWEE
jgi:dCMP deaminase